MPQLTAIVLAAGQGTRMKSKLRKVLHPVAGRPLAYYPVAAAVEAGAEQVVVVASPDNQVALRDLLVGAFADTQFSFTIQDPPRGTGDAARVGLEQVNAERVMILCADTPLLQADDMRALAAVQAETAVELALLSCVVDEPTGYGRVLRDARQRVIEVREHRDLVGEEQRAVREVNAGMYVAPTAGLRRTLAQVTADNSQGEYYLTDVVALAARGSGVAAVVRGAQCLVGVNDRAQLVEAESMMFRRIAERHGRAGVTVRGDARIDDTVVIQADVVIGPGASLRGRTQVAQGAVIDVGCVVTDAVIGEGAVLHPYCVVTNSSVAVGARLGPLVSIGPGPVSG
jgi:bifunctional UDP-N-acetylglucosamine pyrophosphorylase/glucosamine-1-phosphate N-acetyltransferase